MFGNLRKGVTNDDGSYAYTCGCGFKEPECIYCQGNDLDLARAAFKTARGQVYYGLLKTILGHIGKAMVDDVKGCKHRGESFNVYDIGWIAVKYDLNFKATCEWLEETGAIKSGVYEAVKAERSLKVRDILERGRNIGICRDRGSHEEYMIDGKSVCRQCGKTFSA